MYSVIFMPQNLVPLRTFISLSDATTSVRCQVTYQGRKGQISGTRNGKLLSG